VNSVFSMLKPCSGILKNAIGVSRSRVCHP